LVLRDPGLFLRDLGPVEKAMVEGRKKLGLTEVTLTLSGTNASSQQLYELIRTFRRTGSS